MRLLDELGRDEAMRRDDIGVGISQGMHSIPRGDDVDGDGVFDRLEADPKDMQDHDPA